MDRIARRVEIDQRRNLRAAGFESWRLEKDLSVGNGAEYEDNMDAESGDRGGLMCISILRLPCWSIHVGLWQW